MPSFFNLDMLYAIILFVIGHTLAWYTHNLQFVNEFWKDKVVLPTILFGIPCILVFWWATKFAMSAVPELWTARFVAAVMSYITFPIMTWYYLGESMFTIKTMSCVFLAFCILLIQIFVK